MLVLTRNVSEKIKIGDNIVITLVQVRSTGRARIGIEAPQGMKILREELTTHNQKEETND